MGTAYLPTLPAIILEAGKLCPVKAPIHQLLLKLTKRQATILGMRFSDADRDD
jgi:hypothetical protein